MQEKSNGYVPCTTSAAPLEGRSEYWLCLFRRKSYLILDPTPALDPPVVPVLLVDMIHSSLMVEMSGVVTISGWLLGAKPCAKFNDYIKPHPIL